MVGMKGTLILLVDDDHQILDTLSELFKQAGAFVETASTFDEAMMSVQKHRPDVIIVDIMLPGRSGIDIVKEIGTMPAPHPLVVVLTNSINAITVADAVEANAKIFIQKADHDPREIVDMVAKYVDAERQ